MVACIFIILLHGCLRSIQPLVALKTTISWRVQSTTTSHGHGQRVRALINGHNLLGTVGNTYHLPTATSPFLSYCCWFCCSSSPFLGQWCCWWWCWWFNWNSAPFYYITHYLILPEQMKLSCKVVAGGSWLFMCPSTGKTKTPEDRGKKK